MRIARSSGVFVMLNKPLGKCTAHEYQNGMWTEWGLAQNVLRTLQQMQSVLDAYSGNSFCGPCRQAVF